MLQRAYMVCYWDYSDRCKRTMFTVACKDFADTTPDRMPLPACAHAILRNAEMVRLEPMWHEPQLLVDRAYLLAYELGQAGKQRSTFQRAQLPWLGVDVRLVTGYDAEQLQSWHRECMFASTHPANNATHPQKPMYVSQVLKMWAASYEIWC